MEAILKEQVYASNSVNWGKNSMPLGPELLMQRLPVTV